MPVAIVGGIEFLGPTLMAVAGSHTWRNFVALFLTVAGMYVLTDVRIVSETLSDVFAFANYVLFVLYILLSHYIAPSGGTFGIDRLGAAMPVGSVAALPIGIRSALPAFTDPVLLAVVVGVGVSSIPLYVCDQLYYSNDCSH